MIFIKVNDGTEECSYINAECIMAINPQDDGSILVLRDGYKLYTEETAGEILTAINRATPCR